MSTITPTRPTEQAWDFERELQRIPNVSHIAISPAPLYTGYAWTVHIRTFTRNPDTNVATTGSWVGQGATIEEAQRNAIEANTVKIMRYDGESSSVRVYDKDASLLRRE